MNRTPTSLDAARGVRDQSRRLPRSPLGAVLALGIAGQLSQTVLLRELLMSFHGNELSIGLSLAAWLFWVGMGSFIASLVVSRLAHPFRWLTGIALLLLPAMPATIWALRGIRWFFPVMPGEVLGFSDILRVGLPLMGPVCMLWGAVFVLLARIWRMQTLGRRGAVNTYVVEALGNLVGGALFSLVLARRLDALVCAVLAGALLPLALAALSPVQGRRYRRAPLWLAGLAGLALLPVFARLDLRLHAWQWRLRDAGQTWVETRPSAYGRITVTRRNGQFAFYQSGQLAFSAVAADRPDDPLEEQEAALLAHLAMAQHPEPRAVLLIGGGMRGVLRELAAHPLQQIDYVERDPALIAAALPYVSTATRDVLGDPRIRVLSTDGRMHLKTTQDRYDVILVDVGDPVTAALNRFYTREFFREAQQRLRAGGVLCIGADSTSGLRESAVVNRNATLYHSLREVFAHVRVIGDRPLRFFASDTPETLSLDPLVLIRRHRASEAAALRFSPHHFATLMQDNTLRRVAWTLHHHGRTPGAALAPPVPAPLFPPAPAMLDQETDPLPPVSRRWFSNADFRPIGYYYSLLFWSRHARGRPDRLLGAIAHFSPLWLMALPVGVLLAGGLPRLRRPRASAGRVPVALAIAVLTTGFSSMTTQVALLFAFQSQYGFVYEMLGLIVGVFMGGLALGAARCRVVQPFRQLAHLQVVVAAWAGLLALGLPLGARLTSPVGMLLWFGGMTLLAGMWNGRNFPLTLACTDQCRVQTDRGTGLIYGLELFGACCGAVLSGVVLIPVFGVGACLGLTAALNLAAFCVMIFNESWFVPNAHF